MQLHEFCLRRHVTFFIQSRSDPETLLRKLTPKEDDFQSMLVQGVTFPNKDMIYPSPSLVEVIP